MTRILIADDDATILHVVSTLLRFEGYEVETAADGQAALQQVLQRPPELLISDIQMPGLDGLSLLRAIRANPALVAVRVLLLTGQGDDDPALAQALAQGHARLGKPFTREQLLAALRALLPQH
ncbi:MAG: response regulator [Rhodoferax sp.]|nr:response regulator [Rhodoferax sp.]